MDLAPGAGGSGDGGGGSGDERKDSSSSGRKNVFHRHSADKIQRLEEFFKDRPRPDESEREQLSRELGLEPQQIKYWFQNKRTHTKSRNERLDNNSLRTENERFQSENTAIRETLKNILCDKCENLVSGEEARQQNLQRLRDENTWLKKEHDRLLNMVSIVCKRRTSPLESLPTFASGPLSSNLYEPNYFGKGIVRGEGAPKDALYSIDQYTPGNSSMNPILALPQNQFRGIQEVERSVLVETAISAMDELVELLRVNEPLWIKSSTNGRWMIHHDSYDKSFPKITHVNSPQAWIESSKESEIVPMTAMNLVDIFQDPEKWMDFFPTIVTKARNIEVLDIGNRGGSLYLMYEKLHVLSPFVSPREFMFLRYIQQLNPTTWLIVQVSYDSFEVEDASSSQAWMLPSGCMIQDMSNGKSKVTWIEHVHVDDKSLNHQIYKDMVRDSQAYGAIRWLVTLERMCERYAFLMGSRIAPGHELEGVIGAPQSRASMIKLAHKMVKSFHGILSMQEKSDFPQLSEFQKNGYRVSIRKSDFTSDQSNATIVCVATSIRLPISFEDLFHFFRDNKARAEWDVLSNGNPVQEIAHISTGNHPENSISLMQPFVIMDNTNMLILQESCIDALGASLIYAPIEFSAVTSIISGQNGVEIPVLPSGFIISNGHSGVDDGGISLGASSSSGPSTRRSSTASLLTVALQVLLPPDNTLAEEPNMQSVATIHSLVNSTIEKIKMAVGSNIE